MKNKKVIVIIVLVITALVSALFFGSKPTQNIREGRYVTEDGWAFVTIEAGETFSMRRSIATSYDPRGDYIIEGEKLILLVNGDDQETIQFKISDDVLIFESGRLADNLIAKGSNFIYENEIDSKNKIVVSSQNLIKAEQEIVELKEKLVLVEKQLENSKANDTKVEAIETISSFIPEGWEIVKKRDGLEVHHGELAIAEGDLNEDGLMDKAFVIENSTASDPMRPLIVVLGNEDGSYTLSVKADDVVVPVYAGGGFGDSFEDIVIDRGSMVLKFFGGASGGHQFYRYRYQNNDWYLIGYTEGTYNVISDNGTVVLEEDYNLLTGDYSKEKFLEDKIEVIKGTRGIKELLRLEDFDWEEDVKVQF